MNPDINAFFDEASNTFTYVVQEPKGSRCAIIDPVLNYNPHYGRTSTDSADRVIEYVQQQSLVVEWILETHPHADHLTAAPYLCDQLGGKIAIGEHIVEVQKIFKKLFNTESEFATDGSEFDHLFKHDEQSSIGDMAVRVMHTPGHTPACISYIIGDAAFVGDTLFMPDYGTARTDFPGGDAATLYRSIQKILALPANTRLFMCHDYLPPSRDKHQWETSVLEQRSDNIDVGDGVAENEFVIMRQERDKASAVPRLLLPAIQVNMRAGHLPPPEDNGVSYLKIPLNSL
ncbi:MAG: glyoxylase-like metal-dependent hydrolase (beta-lactamase superfamily II) [Gammaproteobacteria bacterium]|jgi:glyoxylase-like metal-dependent hydrolase (beta-lactamase superfamily II)